MNNIIQILIIIFKKTFKKGIYSSGHYTTFDEVTKGKKSGYEDAEFIRSLKQKGKELALGNSNSEITNDDMLILLGIKSAFKNEKINVLDIGGGFGIHYFTSKKHITDQVDNWHIIESNQVVENSNDFATDNLKFFRDINDLPKNIHYDLIIFASSLQYLPCLDNIVNSVQKLNPKFILITRIPLSNEKSFVSQQRSNASANYRGNNKNNQSLVYYPISIINKAELLNKFPNYHVMLSSKNSNSKFYVNWSKLTIYNFLLNLN